MVSAPPSFDSKSSLALPNQIGKPMEGSVSLMSAFSAEFDGDDSTHHEEYLTRGQHYFAQLFSAGPVPGGQSVVVTVGTRTFDISSANDVEVHSRSNFQWFINSVEVRIAP